MSTLNSPDARSGISLRHDFADVLPELAQPWQAEPAPEARLLTLNEALAEELGLDVDVLRSPAGVALLSGTAVPEGATPVAQAYAGHQFGGFSPRLGDGRALLLGELTDLDGVLRDLHLKGSGRTPFARGGDGLAAVGPMLREHVVSEALHHLGIPTTRTLAVLATGRDVRREGLLPGGLMVRVAASHLRVGSVQYARATGDVDLLRRLVDHAIARHHPEVADARQPYLAFYEAVVVAQASLVAQWMAVGFVHGVLNTDNVTLSGQSIDFGPCAFLDAYDPATVFSSIDTSGRYAYANQPSITQWNLARLAEAMLPLIAEDEARAIELAVEALGRFEEHHARARRAVLRRKLGLTGAAPPATDEGVDDLVTDLLGLLAAGRTDFTTFFRRLSSTARGDSEPARELVLDLAGFDAWCDRWLSLGPDPTVMDRANPVYLARNHLVEEALTAATEGDLAPVTRLLEVLSSPYVERAGLERYAEPAPADFGHYRTFCGT